MLSTISNPLVTLKIQSTVTPMLNDRQLPRLNLSRTPSLAKLVSRSQVSSLNNHGLHLRNPELSQPLHHGK